MTEYPTDDAEFSPDAVAAVLTVMPLHGDDQGIAVEVPLQAGQVEWLTDLLSKESDHCRNSHPDESGQCGHCGRHRLRPTHLCDRSRRPRRRPLATVDPTAAALNTGRPTPC